MNVPPSSSGGALNGRASSSSTAMKAARIELNGILGTCTVGQYVLQVSKALDSASACTQQGENMRGAQVLHKALVSLREEAMSKFGELRTTLREALRTARSICRTQGEVVERFGCEDTAGAVALILRQDGRAKSASEKASTLGERLAEFGESAASVAERCRAGRDENAKLAESQRAMAERLHQRRADAWHSHSALLQSLAECGRLHREATGEQRAAERKASVAGLLSFVHGVDRVLGAACGVPVLTPVTAYLRDIEDEVVDKRGASDALLDAKVRQRRLQRDALDDMADCSRQIANAGVEARRADIGADRFGDAARQLDDVVASVLRVEQFCIALKDALLMASGERYANIAQRVSPSKRARSETKTHARAGTEAVWEPCAAVRRRHVHYYCLWAAVEEGCAKWIKEVDEAGLKAAELAVANQFAPGQESRQTDTNGAVPGVTNVPTQGATGSRRGEHI